MSLINDALKKAQKQRTGEMPPMGSMPSIGGEPASRIASGAKPGGSNGLGIQIGIGVAVLVVLVVGGIFAVRLLRSPSNPTPPAAVTPTVASEPTPAPVVPQPLPAAKPTATEATATPTAFVLPTAIAPTPAPAAPVAVAPKAEPKPVVAAPVEAPPAAVAAKPAGPAPKLDSRSVNYIEGLHVAGIRASGSDSKVLMNDRVYRIGDIVEHDLDLKLVGITASSLTFENDDGARYTRNF